MKIYVSADLEGISGIVNFEQTGRDNKGPEYERARRLLTNEVNTVVAACREAGVEKVVVMDGHAGGYNFIVEDLHPEGEYVIGTNRKKSFEGMTDDFDGVILLGYHAMAGTENGVLDHTQSSKTWYNYWINDIKMGELGQSAILAGHRNIPVILVTGDLAVCKEAKELLPHIETVAVKEGYSRTCAKIIPPSAAQLMIGRGVKKALSKIKTMKPYKISFPAKVKIEFQTTDIADTYEKNGWKRVSGTIVEKIVDKPKKGQDLRIL
ncbi:MAG: peptidase M55 D-aminopeptidase [Candidatus Uhrbacteria bacterium GW2011_GWF2_39_13]|uniref:Peptidase M55 D-aminopeptidase n=1 Tax=Candidatus Uhrbacteria bacterium GW2011_GWF2_39_13 TaxID=1618995 RepID=A0A0G0MK44_9BACT|nr:MAG: peptidase M55 D-aminopeptidase [Candidatus Uhrbacteria bacterium GW2011_GWF2_39_13]